MGPDRFAGFPSATFAWFVGLEADNSKAYFERTREAYEGEVRGALELMLEELCDDFGGRVRMFRQHRNLRFRPGGPPYKTTTYGVLEGVPGVDGGLYAQLGRRPLRARARPRRRRVASGGADHGVAGRARRPG